MVEEEERDGEWEIKVGGTLLYIILNTKAYLLLLGTR